MIKEEAKKRIDELTHEINFHNHRYYVLNSPKISDYDFDMLLNELISLEKSYPEYAFDDSPTKRVGGDITKKFNTVKHNVRMMSLDNTYSFEELDDFHQRIVKLIGVEPEYVCELKIDGVAISLHYEGGKLKQAVTRGDGVQGDEVTTNVKTIRSVPLHLMGNEVPNLMEVRGEIFMPVKAFEKLNYDQRKELEDKGWSEEEILESLFKNPRNCASGTLKLQDSKEVSRRKLDAFIYFVISPEIASDNHYESIQIAKKLGFKVSEYIQKCATLQEVKAFITEWETKRFSLDFDTDGIVIKVNHYKLQKLLGETAKSPRWAIAYKYKPERVSTILQSITFQVGRTGAITPVANLKPIQLGGTTVKRASLHNADFIKELDLRIGDTVYVEKGGEIIPKIVAVDHQQRNLFDESFHYITHCPECKTQLIRKEGEAIHYCPNESGCPPQMMGKIIHFTSRKAMNMDSLGEKTIEQLFQQGLIRSYADLYVLTPSQVMQLDGFKEKSTQNVMDAIEASKKIPFQRVLFALGIRYVGETVAKKLAQHFKNIDEISKATIDELCEAEEIGEKIAESIVSFFADNNNQEIIDRLKTYGLQFSLNEEELSNRSDKLNGLTFVISGVFEKYSRDEIKELIQQNGGKITGSISGKTSYLISGENAGPEKIKKAELAGVNIIGEDQFLSLLNLV